ncbi:MAG: hypothetical protein HC906_16285 [Bacteroidales bacterium]|nr:hypothetical protein [Bacteroidales bacterium]
MENSPSNETTWFEAVTKYNSAMVMLENIRAIAGQSISLHKIRKFITRRESERQPDKKKFTDLSPDEILEHANRMKSDIEKIYGFIKQVNN